MPSFISLIFVFCKIIVECAALYLKYSGFLPKLSEAPQFVKIFSLKPLTSRDNVLEDLRRIKGIVDLPILVDCDTGWGSGLNISKTIKEMISAGADAVHLEDQVSEKRCGHIPAKEIVSEEEMVDLTTKNFFNLFSNISK